MAHPEFADDTIAAAHAPPELEAILHDINETSKPVGLNMHLGKTKVVFNKQVTPSPVTLDGKVIEEVDGYVYPGRMLTKNGDILPEIKRRVMLGRVAFGKVDNITRSTKSTIRINGRPA